MMLANLPTSHVPPAASPSPTCCPCPWTPTGVPHRTCCPTTLVVTG